MLFCALYQFCKIAFQCEGAWTAWTHRSDDGRSAVTVTSPSRCHECEAGPVITDNEMSPPEAHNGDEIINALEVEQIQIPLMLDKRTATQHVTIYTPKAWCYFGCCKSASLNSNNNNKTDLARVGAGFVPRAATAGSPAPAYHGHQQNTTPVTLSHRICIRQLIIHKL